jgi:hypothetical protein
MLLNIHLLSLSLGIIIMYLRGHVIHGDSHFVAVVKFRKNDPSRPDAQNRNTEIETNADKMVGVSFGLHPVIY